MGKHASTKIEDIRGKAEQEHWDLIQASMDKMVLEEIIAITRRGGQPEKDRLADVEELATYYLAWRFPS